MMLSFPFQRLIRTVLHLLKKHLSAFNVNMMHINCDFKKSGKKRRGHKSDSYVKGKISRGDLGL